MAMRGVGVVEFFGDFLGGRLLTLVGLTPAASDNKCSITLPSSEGVIVRLC